MPLPAWRNDFIATEGVLVEGAAIQREGGCVSPQLQPRSSFPSATAGAGCAQERQDSCSAPLLVLLDPYPGRKAQPLQTGAGSLVWIQHW